MKPISFRIQGNRVQSDDVQPLTAEALRRVPFGAVVDRAIEGLRAWQGYREVIVRAGGTTLSDSGYAQREREVVRGLRGPIASATRQSGRPRTDPDTIRRAAELYASRAGDSRRALLETSEALGVSRLTAYR